MDSRTLVAVQGVGRGVGCYVRNHLLHHPVDVLHCMQKSCTLSGHLPQYICPINLGVSGRQYLPMAAWPPF